MSALTVWSIGAAMGRPSSADESTPAADESTPAADESTPAGDESSASASPSPSPSESAPEGGELCVFLSEDVPSYRTYELCVDAVDGERMARWWADVFGVEPLNQGRSYWWIEGVPGMPFELMVFDTVLG